jgi:hypothetical protein
VHDEVKIRKIIKSWSTTERKKKDSLHGENLQTRSVWCQRVLGDWWFVISYIHTYHLYGGYRVHSYVWKDRRENFSFNSYDGCALKCPVSVARIVIVRKTLDIVYWQWLSLDAWICWNHCLVFLSSTSPDFHSSCWFNMLRWSRVSYVQKKISRVAAAEGKVDNGTTCGVLLSHFWFHFAVCTHFNCLVWNFISHSNPQIPSSIDSTSKTAVFEALEITRFFVVPFKRQNV